MQRAEDNEVAVHGRGRNLDDKDELRFGVTKRRFNARVRRPVEGAQWTGIVTQTALTMLRKGMVDAVVATGCDDNDRFVPRPKLCYTEEEVLSCRGVKPILAPVLAILSDVDEAIRRQKVKRLLFIGVGCQVRE